MTEAVWNVGDVHEHGNGFQSVVVWCYDGFAILWCGYDSLFYPVKAVSQDLSEGWSIAGESEDSFDDYSHALNVALLEVIRERELSLPAASGSATSSAPPLSS
jgi:hypothetical protein